MQLSQFLDFEAIRFDMAAGNKRQLLNQLSQIAAARLSIDPSQIADAIAERERLGSTGFGGGVAIPHGKLRSIDRLMGVFARLARPVDFDAVDDLPVDLAFLLLAPEGAGADHLKALARIARVLRNQGIAQQLRATDDAEALYALLVNPLPTSHAAA